MKYLAAIPFILLIGMPGCARRAYLTAPELRWNWEEGTTFRSVIEERRWLTDWRVTEAGERTKAVTRVTGFDGMAITHLNIAPDGGRLVFHAGVTVEGRKTLRVFSVDIATGKEIVAISGDQGRNYSPCYSDEARDVLFCSDITGVSKLWMIAGDGSQRNLRRVTGSRYAEMDPDVSRDGKKIVFSALLPGGRRPTVCVINRDGTEPTYLREGASPKFSPDGESIVFTAPGAGEQAGNAKYDQIWIMDISGNSPKQLTRAEGNCRSSRWSPDGRWIVYAGDDPAGDGDEQRRVCNYDLWLIDAQGESDPVRLTDNPATDLSPVWSSDGKCIYFCSSRERNWNIWRINLAESVVMRMSAPEITEAVVAGNAARIAWKHSVPPGREEPGGYNVYFRPLLRKTFWQANEQPVRESSFEIKNLLPGEEYSFAVSAVLKNALLEGPLSSEVRGTASRLPPSPKISAVIKSETIVVSWGRVEGAEGYNIYFRPYFRKLFWKANENVVKATEYPFSGSLLAAGVEYQMYVTAVDRNGVEGERSRVCSALFPAKKENNKGAAPEGWGASSKNEWGGGDSGAWFPASEVK